MNEDIKIKDAVEYFSYFQNVDLELENETENPSIPLEQQTEVTTILALEISINLLRGTNYCGSLIDSLVTLRAKLRNEYNTKYEAQ